MTATDERVLDGWGDPVDVDAWHDGYTAGHTAALAARPHRDVFLPVERRWRHTTAGDVFLGRGGALWQLAAVEERRGGYRVHAWHAGVEHVVDVDPDDTIRVLHQRPEVDALDLLAEQLGATLVGRTGDPP